MIEARTLTDAVLIETIARLAARCRETTADLIAHLVVLEERNLHLACGFNSLWGYCHRVLGCSENGSYDRMAAAHAARRFPVVLAMLADGSLHLTSVRLLAPHLKDEDHLALLGGARRQSSQKVRELLARWFPQPDVPALVRRLPGARGRRRGAAEVGRPALDGMASSSQAAGPLATVGTASAVATASAGAGTAAVDGPAEPATHAVADASGLDSGGKPAEATVGANRPAPSSAPAPAPPRRAVEPLSPGRNLFRFTGDDETAALLREAQELLSHCIPNGDVAAIFKRALSLVVADARRRRCAATKQEESATRKEGSGTREEGSATAETGRRSDPASRHLPAEVERVVWDRDGGQCAFVAGSGWRCDARRFLEYHHLRPWIVGGPPSAENIALRCRAHNQYEANVYFAPIRAAMSDVGPAVVRPPTGSAA